MRFAKPVAMLTPASLVPAALFLAPMGYFFLQSFWQIKFYMLDMSFTLANYGALIEQYGACWIFTLEIAALIAVVTTTGAYLLAYYAHFKAGKYEGLILFLTLMTLFGGYPVKVYAWKTILGTDGIINSLLIGLHLIRQPLNGLLYTPFAVVVTLVNFLLPFAVLLIYASIRTTDPRTLESDIPELVVCADLSHYVVAREFDFPIDTVTKSHLTRILSRAGSTQGRAATRQQVQIPFQMPQYRPWFEQFKAWWAEGFPAWRERNAAAEKLIFLCELGPPDYAITGADRTELSDRWEEALVLRETARALWEQTAP